MQVFQTNKLYGELLSAAGLRARLLSTSNRAASTQEGILSFSNDIRYLKFLRSHRTTLRSSRVTAKNRLDFETNYVRNVKDTSITSKLKMWPMPTSDKQFFANQKKHSTVYSPNNEMTDDNKDSPKTLKNQNLGTVLCCCLVDLFSLVYFNQGGGGFGLLLLLFGWLVSFTFSIDFFPRMKINQVSS